MGQKEVDHLITLQANQVPLREVLDQIEEQTGLSFSYSTRLVDDGDPVSIHVTREPLDSVLKVLFTGHKVRYEIIERQIVLKRARRVRVEVEASIDNLGPGGTPVQFTISGYVKDMRTGEILIGATVSIPGGLQGTITNNYGFYSLTLKEEVEELICSYVGYRHMVIPFTGSSSQTVHFTMEKELARLSEVTIYSSEQENIIRTSRSSEERIDAESVRKMPALFGEKDVIKSLAAIPGIKFFGDGSTIFYVRGGGRDQNMITIDEAPVYNPTHLLGFFSTIVPDAIKDVKIYKGDFPASYGGRLSSLIDIRTKDGNMNRFGMDGSLGLLSSRLSLEGPIWKEHISFFVSGRRSYITRPLQKSNPRINDLHFSDFHLKLNYHINTKNRVFFSMYRGEDNFAQQNSDEQSSGINWQNSTTTLRWNHLFSDKLFSNLTLLGSRYDYYLNTHIENNDYWNSHIDNVSLKYDFTWYVQPDNTFRFGMLIAGHFHNPGNYYHNGQEFDPGLDLSTKYTREYAFYASNQFIINNKLSVRAGMRLTVWQNLGYATEYDVVKTTGSDLERDSLVVTEHPAGEVYHQSFSLDPRLSMIYQPGTRHIFKLSYSRTSQFQYLITNSISPFTSLEVWLPAGPNVDPQYAHQFTLGYTHRFDVPGLSLDIETYFKGMRNLIDYRDHARMLMNPLVEYELRFGKGKGYGVEVILNKERGTLNGWISYTLSRAIYQVDEINQGNPYPAYSDRPHDFSFYLSWSLNPRITLTGNFIYMTGAPFTTPTGFYFYDNHQVPIYAERNNDRLPDYHRLDVALNWHMSKPERKFQHELIFSIYNLYNRKNPVALHFNKTEIDNGSYVVPYDFYSSPELVSTHFYLYGIVPSVSYHFKF
ncbi:MAG: TonB-dependent receptor [Bacteroidales bacterium]|nr:TonB-dependent receptor [Bacteroidales bacterium]